MSQLAIPRLNEQLDDFAPAADLRALAARGIRGEWLFALPLVLSARPRLLGYYRLLLGYSQKEFYNKGGLGRFARMESAGELSAGVKTELEPLCRALAQRASEMAKEIGFAHVSLQLLDDLTLLTLGPQLRGGTNTAIGKAANEAVFHLMQGLVAHALIGKTSRQLDLRNAAGRAVSIAFASDPDIVVAERVSAKILKLLVAIEIKGGSDKSNVWNRLGEAEKSHQSAKQNGFVEFWTIYNVTGIDLAKAHEKSPTTTRFYNLLDLMNAGSAADEDFRDRLIALVGIKPAGIQK